MAYAVPLWMQNATYPAEDDRRLIGVTMTAGVLGVDDLKVQQRGAGPNMSVDITAGACVVEGTKTAGQGRYLCCSTETMNKSLAASPALGQSRIDLIVSEVRDSAVEGGSDDWRLQVVTGTATSGEPVKPAVPASSLLLAYVTVVGGASSITNSAILDRRHLSGNPGIASARSIFPSFDGQLTTDHDTGLIYIGRSGTWTPAYPQVTLPEFESHEVPSFTTSSTSPVLVKRVVHSVSPANKRRVIARVVGSAREASISVFVRMQVPGGPWVNGQVVQAHPSSSAVPYLIPLVAEHQMSIDGQSSVTIEVMMYRTNAGGSGVLQWPTIFVEVFPE